jgi:Fe-S-cluster containining protein
MGSGFVSKVVELYAVIDRHTSALQAATGLHCPPGCGRCCSSEEVEATVVEMLPLAVEVFRLGEAERWLELIDRGNSSEACVLYQADVLVSGNGRCSFYAWRPIVCRLFGFAAVKNKHGKPELVACAREKEIMPLAVVRAQEGFAAGAQAPNFTDYSLQIRGLEPGGSLMPVNLAVQLALEREGLRRRLDEERADDVTPVPPISPTLGKAA